MEGCTKTRSWEEEVETLVSCSQTLPEEWLLETKEEATLYYSLFSQRKLGCKAYPAVTDKCDATKGAFTLTAVPPDFFPFPLDDSAASAPPDPVVLLERDAGGQRMTLGYQVILQGAG